MPPTTPAPKVGDILALPSGKRVRVSVVRSPKHPWVALQTGVLWHVCKEHGHANQAGVSFYFDTDRNHPLQLDQADAQTLAAALNRVR